MGVRHGVAFLRRRQEARQTGLRDDSRSRRRDLPRAVVAEKPEGQASRRTWRAAVAVSGGRGLAAGIRARWDAARCSAAAFRSARRRLQESCAIGVGQIWSRRQPPRRGIGRVRPAVATYLGHSRSRRTGLARRTRRYAVPAKSIRLAKTSRKDESQSSSTWLLFHRPERRTRSRSLRWPSQSVDGGSGAGSR